MTEPSHTSQYMTIISHDESTKPREGWAIWAVKDGVITESKFLSDLVPQARDSDGEQEAKAFLNDPAVVKACQQLVVEAGPDKVIVQFGWMKVQTKWVSGKIAEDFPTRLRSLVADRHKDSLSVAAKAWGTHPEILNTYLMGTVGPSFNWACAVAQMEGVSLDWLAFGTKAGSNSTPIH